VLIKPVCSLHHVEIPLTLIASLRRLSFADSRLGRASLDKRLSAFLKVFAAVNGPQQLYKHQLLLLIFTCFVSNQESSVAQCALSCVLKFKQSFVTPYADHLKGMLKKGELRDTMLNFDISKDANVIDPDHRSSLLPLITRIMFGRLSARAAISKSSKETPASRRASVLSFLSVLDGREGELYPLFYQMIRSYIPKQHQLQPVERHEMNDKRNILLWLQSVEAEDLSHLRDQRHEGFLNLLTAAIAQFGHDIKAYVPAFMSIILALCKYAQVGGDSDAGADRPDGDETEDMTFRQPSRKGVLRTLCFRRLADLFDTFASSIDFLPYATPMWGALAFSVRELPVTVAYADKAPALLSLFKTLSTRPQLIHLLSLHEEAVPSAIKCIADTSKQSVANAALDFVENLLTNGCDGMDEDVSVLRNTVGVALIEKHLSLLLQQFVVRLGSSSLRQERSTCTQESEHTARRMGVNAQCTTRRELSILCRISSLIVDSDDVEDDQEVLQLLCELLVPFLSPDRRSKELDQMHVMEILSALIPRIEANAAVGYFSSLSRLFGPHKANRGITSLAVRKTLASVIETIAKAGSREDLQPAADLAVRLCALHSKRVDEIDYDEVLGALNNLATAEGWTTLCGVRSSAEGPDPTVLSPLICLCFHYLYDEDGVVSRAAFKGLKTLISCAAREANSEVSATGEKEDSAATESWVKLVETSVVPTCRNGLASKSKSARRLFVLLFAEVARCFKGYSSPNLYGDLSSLTRDDDPDLDFFLNVTHVQIHRRTRAFQRLRKMLHSDAECPFSMQSLSNFLLPLAMHPIYESKTKLEEAIALEAVETVGAIARHLSWSKYHSALWTLLTQFERNPEQERYLVGAICSVIDAFHFELVDDNVTTDDGATDSTNTSGNTAVWRALERRIIPKTESLLIKEKVDRAGTKVKNLRPSVVLALSKLFRKFPVSFFESRLTRLLVVICGALKSRDSDAREIARKTLAKMTVEMDIAYLSDVIRQLAVSLTEGYQLHVRMATLHTILQTVSKTYEPQMVKSSDSLPVIPFDSCIPAMMDLIQQDLFGDARERKEAEGAMKRLVKEASGSKGTDAIELICRMLTFRPSSAARGSNSSKDAVPVSAIHAVVTPLLERLRTPDATTRTVGRIGECLTRVVVGVSHNKTATSEEVLPFVYASIAPFVGQYKSPLGAGQSDDESSEDEDDEKGIQISRTGTGGSMMALPSKRASQKKTKKANVVEWRPSTLNTATSAHDARVAEAQQRLDLRLVKDGASAPKLTGSGRFTSSHMPANQSLNDPVNISGVTFGLSLLYSSLKKGNFDSSDDLCRSMLDPFIPMLSACVCGCRNNDVVLLGLRCLGVLLRLKLPSAGSYSSVLGAKTLDILTSSGNLSNLNQELTQVCFKTLTLLINLDAAQSGSKPSMETGNSMPLDADQMQVLISLLKAAIVESDHHHPTLGLIKAIVSRQFVSSEFYDLMDTMLDLSVKSHKATLREVRRI
jgi:U3 small nucleolar RNA-associated protein 20